MHEATRPVPTHITRPCCAVTRDLSGLTSAAPPSTEAPRESPSSIGDEGTQPAMPVVVSTAHAIQVNESRECPASRRTTPQSVCAEAGSSEGGRNSLVIGPLGPSTSTAKVPFARLSPTNPVP